MPPELGNRAVAEDWLRYAASNLVLARQPKPAGVLWGHLCFNAQQAAEQAVKAALALRGIDFPRTHLIGTLLELARRGGMQVPDGLQLADDLSGYAVTTRYPGETEAIREDEYRRAVQLAEQVVRWAESVVRGA